MSNSVLSFASQAADKPATEIGIGKQTVSTSGSEAGLDFNSTRSPTVLIGVPSFGVELPSRPFSPTAPEFIPGAVYASRQGLNTITSQADATRPSQDDYQGGVSLVPQGTPVITNSGPQLYNLPSSTEHRQEVATGARNRTLQAFHRTDSTEYELGAPPQYQTAPPDSLSRHFPYYTDSNLSDASHNAQLPVPFSSQVTADSQTTGPKQSARLSLHNSISENKWHLNHPGPFDGRWIESPEEMWNSNATRNSPLTISPGESGSDNEGEHESSESSSDRVSFVNAVIYPKYTIGHANPSESLKSWLDAVGSSANGRKPLDLKQSPAHSFSVAYGMKGDKTSMALDEQHQAREHLGKSSHDMSSVVLNQTNEDSEHNRALSSHAGTDIVSIKRNSAIMASTLQVTSEGSVAKLTKSTRSALFPVPYRSRRQGSTESFLASDRMFEIVKGRTMDAAVAFEEFANKHHLFDQGETGPGSHGNATWMSLLPEIAKRRRATAEVRTLHEDTGLDKDIGVDEKHGGGLCASALSQELPSVVVTPNIDSPQILGKVNLFEGMDITAHEASASKTSGAEHTVRQSLQVGKENRPQLESNPGIYKNTENAFSSQVSVTMNIANTQVQEERVKTLRILQTQLSPEITIQDTYGKQQCSPRLRAAPGEQLYYEMRDLNDRPYLLPWPPEEGSPAYIARHKPEHLLYLEAHPQGFFISHPIQCSEEIIRAHYLWLSTGLSNIDSHGNPYETHSELDNTRSGNQLRSATQGKPRKRPTSIQNEIQQYGSNLGEYQHFTTSRSGNRAPSINQNIQQDRGNFQIKDTRHDRLDPSDAMNTEQQAIQSFVPTTTGPLIIFENGPPSLDISNTSLATSVSASQSAGYASVSSPTYTGLSALAVLNSNRLGYSESAAGSSKSNHSPAVLHYRPGVDTMFPVPMARPSSRYRRLTCCGQPTYEVATKDEFQPFVEAARLRKPAFWGVMKFIGIPYAVTKQDILAFLGRNAKILTPNYGEPIHIIMERATGKTMDAYVEFLGHADAQAAVNKFMRGRMEQDRSFRMMDRHVKVELSSQEALMRDLFPKAKNVRWNGQIPIIVSPDDPFNSGFKSFLSGEELHTLTKLVDNSNGPMFCRQCPSRPYENMISTLHKFPWFAVQLYTLFQRDQLFNATLKMLRALITAVSPMSSFGLTSELLTDLLYAGLNAPGFSEKQKWDLCQAADWGAKSVAISPLAKGWPWLVLARKPDWDDDVVMYYAQIFNAYNQKRISPIGANDSFFGDILTSRLQISVNDSLEAVAQTEWQHFKDLVKLALDHPLESRSEIRNNRPGTQYHSTTNNRVTRSHAETNYESTINNVSVARNGQLAKYCAGEDNFAAMNHSTVTSSHAKASYAPESIGRQALKDAFASKLLITNNSPTTSQFPGTKSSVATINLPAMSHHRTVSTPPWANYSTGDSILPSIAECATTSHRPIPNSFIGTGSSPATNNFPVPNNHSGWNDIPTPSYLPGTSNHKSRGSFFMPSKSPTTSTFSGTGMFAMTSGLSGTHSRVSSISPAEMGTFPAIGTAAPPRFTSDVESAVVPKPGWL